MSLNLLKRCDGPILLMLMTHIIHRSMLHFVVAGCIVYLSNTWKKILTGRKCWAYGILHKICGKTTNNLDVKLWCSPCFRSHNLYPRVPVLWRLPPISFFLPNKKFSLIFTLKRIICTLLLCHKNIGHYAHLKGSKHLVCYWA